MSETARPPSVRPDTSTETVSLEVDGVAVTVPAEASLLEALRDSAGARSPKDGCSPQGQCGCCTVLVDGAPRVACVTPVRRVAGRSVTTFDGMDATVRANWAEAFVATGASQCGFCTPGIIVRLAGLHAKGSAAGDHAALGRALAAHMCRCTGWATIAEAWDLVAATTPATPVSLPSSPRRFDMAERRAEIEGHTPQRVGAEVASGRGGFSDDSAPEGALVAVPDGEGGWAVGESLAEARSLAGKTQGRRTTLDPEPPLDLPGGDWAVTLRTSWVEPAYLETDAAWCLPGGQPSSPLGNGGAFGGKVASPAPEAARTLAKLHGRAVRVLLSREDTVRLGPKRPPVAAGLRPDGGGVLRVVRTPGFADRLAAFAPEIEIEEVDVAGPPTSIDLRAAGWAEVSMLRAALAGSPQLVALPGSGTAEASLVDGTVQVTVSCGDPLDEVVLRSYCIGAAHMALGWIRSEGLSVADDGSIGDLTVRSFGVLRALDTPPIHVEIDRSPAASSAPPLNGSDAVFVAVAAAAWIDEGCPTDLPARRGSRR